MDNIFIVLVDDDGYHENLSTDGIFFNREDALNFIAEEREENYQTEDFVIEHWQKQEGRIGLKFINREDL